MFSHFIRQTTHIFRRSWRSWAAAAVIALFGAGRASAAGPGSFSPLDAGTPPGIEPGPVAGSYPLSDFDSVNVFSGNMSVHLPLLKVGGRGQAGYTITLPLNSKRWRIDKLCGTGGQWNAYCEDNVYQMPHFWTRVGDDPLDAVDYSPGRVMFRHAVEHPAVPGPCPVGENTPSAFTRLTFTAPDGAEYEFRDALTNGQPKDANCSADPIPTGFNRGKIFVSVDANAATFISDLPVVDCVNAFCDDRIADRPTGQLVFRDGVRYRINLGRVTQIKDRNGNTMELTYGADTPLKLGKLIKVVDSQRRVTTINYDLVDTDGSHYDEIWSGGFELTDYRVLVRKVSLHDALRGGSGYSVHPAAGDAFNPLFTNLPIYPNYTPPNFDPLVVRSVEMDNIRIEPNPQTNQFTFQYQFKYNPYGEIAAVVLPTGGRFEYDYDFPGGNWRGQIDPYPKPASNRASYMVNRRLTERRVYVNAQTLEKTMTFTLGASGDGEVVTVAEWGAGGMSRTTRHTFGGFSAYTPPSALGETPWITGKPLKVEVCASTASCDSPLRSTTNTWRQVSPDWWFVRGTDDAAPINGAHIMSSSTTLDNGMVSKKDFRYDDYDNQTDEWHYDYDGSLMRHTHTVYQAGTYATNTAVHIRDLPTSVRVNGPNEDLQSETDYEYDVYTATTGHAALVDRPDMFAHEYGPGRVQRGNATMTKKWVTGTTWINTYQQFDVAGNVVKAIDGRGFTTTLNYDDKYGDATGDAHGNWPPTQMGGLFSYANVTSVTNPKQQTVYIQYDYFTGKPVNYEDANGVLSQYLYRDNFARLTFANRGIGIPTVRAEAELTYDDKNRTITVARDANVLGDHLDKTTTLYDGLGRAKEVQRYTNATDYVSTTTSYDADSHARTVSNPFRPGDTPVYTTTDYDALGRVESVTQPGGAQTTTTYVGNQATVTDPAGKVRQSTSDAADRVTRVIEDPSGLGYVTSYNYDAIGNLEALTQTGQTRTFDYDGLSRLRSATNPESGTVTYTYDPNNNVKTRTDARSVLTTYAYDALNRPTSKTYSDGTPTATFTYDTATPAVPYSVGRMIQASVGARTTRFDSYDAFGRVLQSTQTTAAVPYVFKYTYDRGGKLRAETYPSGRVVRTSYNAAGWIAKVFENDAAGNAVPYADSISYAPHGDLLDMRLGNNLWESIDYNARLQPIFMGVGTAADARDVWQLANDFEGAVGPAHNNGNVLGQVSTMGWYTNGTYDSRTFTTGYMYDGVNRLKIATDAGRGGQDWTQTYAYDPFGNRAVTAGLVLANGLTPQSIADYDGRNRLVGGATASTSVFDEAGNLKQDARGLLFNYDAENRQTGMGSTPGVNDYVYAYDANSHRVRATGPNGFAANYVYDVMGRLVAEYVGTERHEYVFGPRGRLADVTSGGTRYFTTDHLGSTRLLTDAAGAILTRYDYLPFGESIPASGSGGERANVPGYARVGFERFQFTGKERDVENGLDYFGARYYSGAAGRFTSTDPTFVWDRHVSDPQQWNRYAYVRNNSLKFVDPDGKVINLATAAGGAVLGAGLGAIGSIGIQLYQKGEVNWTDVGATAAGGFVSGGLAGLTLGASVALQGVVGVAVVGAGTNVVGGAVTRALDSDPNTQAISGKGAIIDAAAGALGGIAGKGMSAAASAEAKALTMRASAYAANGEAQMGRDALKAAADMTAADAATNQAVAGTATSNVLVPAVVAVEEKRIQDQKIGQHRPR